MVLPVEHRDGDKHASTNARAHCPRADARSPFAPSNASPVRSWGEKRPVRKSASGWSAAPPARKPTRCRAIAYEKFGRWFDAEEPLLRAKERTDAGSSPFRHPRSELIAPLLQEAPSAFNNRKLHMRLPWAGWKDAYLAKVLAQI